MRNMTVFTESTVEQAALAWLKDLGYLVLSGPDISPGGDALTPALSRRERESYGQVTAERESYGQVWLPHRLCGRHCSGSTPMCLLRRWRRHSVS
ncbi:MAG: hypothetical protein DDT32_00936 [Syntrophomonadaceae bacterium]|nr:hypothetical protein [Bacillota bacterium]